MNIKYAKDTSKLNEPEFKVGVWYPIESAPKEEGEVFLTSDGETMVVTYSYDKYSNYPWDTSHWTTCQEFVWTPKYWSPLPFLP